MFSKLIGAVLIIIGIAGLILPIVPGILLIMAGILLLTKNRPVVDWAWVKEELKKREKICSGGGNERDAAITKSLDESLLKAKALSKPDHIHTVKKIAAIGEDFIELEGGARFSAGKIAGYIKGAGHIVIFLATIGERIENAAGELTKGKEPLEGYLLDRLGSFAVESLAESVEKKIRKDYSILKKSVSRRYSPGYCDWPIEEQRILAGVLDFSKIGVTLNENCMMSPKKSISAIVAIADEGVFTESGSTCGVCEKKDCSYRRVN
ncbi:MAG: vitamin B12 dependent-methionine synthase activation domain-containing protein [Candidatus Omnitrophota bacterium]|nr:vitamin B12 dependent-methionine synthase activation domain-containing protein [Candidatus Omnitrophota bacterium]